MSDIKEIIRFDRVLSKREVLVMQQYTYNKWDFGDSKFKTFLTNLGFKWKIFKCRAKGEE